MKKVFMYKYFTLVLAVLVVVVAGCSSSSDKVSNTSNDKQSNQGSERNEEKELVNVKIGTLKSLNNAFLFLGAEQGIFEENGVDLEFVPFDSAQPISVAAQTGDIDVGSTAFTAGFFNLVNDGDSSIKVVADASKEYPGYAGQGVLVSKGAYADGVQSVKDLKGKKIGVSQVGSPSQFIAGKLLEQEGLSIDDVEIVTLGSVANIMAALQSEQIDATVLNSTSVANAVTNDTAEFITWVSDEMELQLSGLFFSQNMNDNDEKSKLFLKGYIESVRYYYDNILSAEDKESNEFKNAMKVLNERTGVEEESIAENLPYIDRNAELWVENVEEWIEWFGENDLLVGDVDIKNVVDVSAYEAALSELGE